MTATESKPPKAKRVPDPEKVKLRNQRRRERYANDAAYREQVRTTSRDGYRSRAGSKWHAPVASLEEAIAIGTVRSVSLPGDVVEDRLTFTLDEVCAVFNRSRSVINRWIADGRFPPPIVPARMVSRVRDFKIRKGVSFAYETRVYLLPELEALYTVLKPHFDKVNYFRNDHVEESSRIHAAVRAVRATMGLPLS
jgi:hypothetical protein